MHKAAQCSSTQLHLCPHSYCENGGGWFTVPSSRGIELVLQAHARDHNRGSWSATWMPQWPRPDTLSRSGACGWRGSSCCPAFIAKLRRLSKQLPVAEIYIIPLASTSYTLVPFPKIIGRPLVPLVFISRGIIMVQLLHSGLAWRRGWSRGAGGDCVVAAVRVCTRPVLSASPVVLSLYWHFMKVWKPYCYIKCSFRLFPSPGIFFWRHGQMDWDSAGWDGVLDRPRGPALWLHRRGDVRERHSDGQADLLVRSSAVRNGTEVKQLYSFP